MASATHPVLPLLLSPFPRRAAAVSGDSALHNWLHRVGTLEVSILLQTKCADRTLSLWYRGQHSLIQWKVLSATFGWSKVSLKCTAWEASSVSSRREATAGSLLPHTEQSHSATDNTNALDSQRSQHWLGERQRSSKEWPGTNNRPRARLYQQRHPSPVFIWHTTHIYSTFICFLPHWNLYSKSYLTHLCPHSTILLFVTRLLQAVQVRLSLTSLRM